VLTYFLIKNIFLPPKVETWKWLFLSQYSIYKSFWHRLGTKSFLFWVSNGQPACITFESSLLSLCIARQKALLKVSCTAQNPRYKFPKTGSAFKEAKNLVLDLLSSTSLVDAEVEVSLTPCLYIFHIPTAQWVYC